MTNVMFVRLPRRLSVLELLVRHEGCSAINLIVYDPDVEDLATLAEWAVVKGHEVTGVFLTVTDCIARCRRSPPDAVFVSGLYRCSDDGVALAATLAKLGVSLMVAGVGIVLERSSTPAIDPTA